MVRLLRHRQTKGAATDRLDLRPPRHIFTLPDAVIQPSSRSGFKRQHGCLLRTNSGLLEKLMLAKSNIDRVTAAGRDNNS